jgi:hypothetical protein
VKYELQVMQPQDAGSSINISSTMGGMDPVEAKKHCEMHR